MQRLREEREREERKGTSWHNFLFVREIKLRRRDRTCHCFSEPTKWSTDQAGHRLSLKTCLSFCQMNTVFFRRGRKVTERNGCMCVCGCLFETTTRKQTVHRISFPRCQWVWQEKRHGKWCRTWVKEENETHWVCRQRRICIAREKRGCAINWSIVTHWAFRQVNNRQVVSHRFYDRSVARTFSNHYPPDARRAVWEGYRRTSPVHWSRLVGSMEMFSPDSMTTHCGRSCIHRGRWWLFPALLRLNSIQWHLEHLEERATVNDSSTSHSGVSTYLDRKGPDTWGPNIPDTKWNEFRICSRINDDTYLPLKLSKIVHTLKISLR